MASGSVQDGWRMIMTKIDALENIKETWENDGIDLGEKIISIASDFYSYGLDLAGTAAFIKATPVELDTLLSLSELDDDLIKLISVVNPPKTTWAIIANANDDEVREALLALKDMKDNYGSSEEILNYTYSEYIYKKMLEVSGPTLEDRVASISGDDLKYISIKAASFDVLNEWESKFLTSIANQKKIGKVLSDKQIDKLIPLLEKLSEKEVITRDSIDNDQAICNRILDALGQ